MKKNIFLALVIVLFVFVSNAAAHSTQGRLKITLDKEILTKDDVAYYVESYVLREKYKATYATSKNRFIVDEFLGIEQADGKAVVAIRVLDKKNNNHFNDKVSLVRGGTGDWTNPDDPDANVFTYVNKTWYYYSHYFVPGLGIAAVLACLNYLLQYFRKSKDSEGEESVAAK